MSIAYRLTAVMLAISLPSLAHLDQASLKPAGGETFKPGDVMTIEWMATQAHDGKYDIYYSSNGGTSWPTEFAEAWQGPTTNNTKVTYRWTIPANTANTTQGRIRVCQLFGGHCIQPGTYTIMSTNFTISNTTAVQPEAAARLRPSGTRRERSSSTWTSASRRTPRFPCGPTMPPVKPWPKSRASRWRREATRLTLSS